MGITSNGFQQSLKSSAEPMFTDINFPLAWLINLTIHTYMIIFLTFMFLQKMHRENVFFFFIMINSWKDKID